ncbi:MAG: HAD hydrolase family protein [Gammaproteobacteria bacterium]|nr:HAD hydrolase family protein [Gammaproteobacteria bacterium]MCZ6716929.1 HAD hydrolase family protein [Gammaproteobacteria bacterium]MCZ6826298.1 HAD hydrolase family protein [Gammaproteobacteria bacterium]MCZ6911968.1 HAD hydrolase family protein [Pseudomonadota bacterium]
MSADLEKLAASIELLILDVDGVLTDGRLYFSANGDEAKAFHVRDGYGIGKLLASGVQVAVISGRQSAAVSRRMNELGVKHVYQGCSDKISTLRKLLKELGLGSDVCAFMGDDIPDLEAMQSVALPLCVANAHPRLLACAKWRSKKSGGDGAVREACDLIREARKSYRQ